MLERSSLLAALEGPIVHGFSTRRGGVSSGRHATLNVAGGADEAVNVAENLARLGREGGFDPQQLYTARQVHGCRVLRGREHQPDSEADALWWAADDGRGVVAVRSADCVPVLLADRRKTVVAAIHSGWRGTVAEVVPATVATLAREAGISPHTLVAAIGPCIEWERFEVGPEVAAKFPPQFVHRRGSERHRVDLVATIREQLQACGVRSDSIERVGGCTYSDPTRYFSYRRDGAGMGQHLSFIGFAR